MFFLCERHKSAKAVCWKGLKKLSHDKFCMTIIVCRAFKEKVQFVPSKRSITLEICPLQKISYTWYVSLWFCFILANFVVGHQSSYACFVTSIFYFFSSWILSTANFHLTNGAVLWRINFLADTSIRGLNQSCSLMVNYRYYLSDTENNSQNYLLHHHIPASPAVMELLGSEQSSAASQDSGQWTWT